MVESINDLIKIFKQNKDIYLYGAGVCADRILSFAKLIGEGGKIKAMLQTVQESPIEYKNEKVTLRFRDVVNIVRNSKIIVSTMLKWHSEISDTLEKAECHNVVYISDNLMDEIMLFLKYSSSVHNNEVGNELILKTIRMPQLSFSVHLCEHCNLNCAGCNNMAPLANESFTDMKKFEKDMKRLSVLSGGDAHRISLTGGEPLLNPRAAEYAKIARECFPNTRIAFISNGLLIKKMPDDFWNICKDYDICMDLTTYPIGIDYMELVEYIIKKKIKARFFEGSTTKIWRKEKFNLKPDQNRNPAVCNWAKCYKVGECMQLYNGKMACTTVMNAKYFMNTFQKECCNMHYTDRDFIDIYEVSSIDQIFDFFAKPFPFCKYCMPDETEIITWHQSSGEILEWI